MDDTNADTPPEQPKRNPRRAHGLGELALNIVRHCDAVDQAEDEVAERDRMVWVSVNDTMDASTRTHVVVTGVSVQETERDEGEARFMVDLLAFLPPPGEPWPAGVLEWDLLGIELQVLLAEGVPGDARVRVLVQDSAAWSPAAHTCEWLEVFAFAPDSSPQLMATRWDFHAGQPFPDCPDSHERPDWLMDDITFGYEGRDSPVLDFATQAWREVDPGIDMALLDRYRARSDNQVGHDWAQADLGILLHRLAHHWRLAVTYREYQAVLHAIGLATELAYILSHPQALAQEIPPWPSLPGWAPELPQVRFAERSGVYRALLAVEETHAALDRECDPEWQPLWSQVEELHLVLRAGPPGVLDPERVVDHRPAELTTNRNGAAA